MVFSTTILKEHSTNNNSNKDKEEEKHLPVPSTGDTALPSPGKARRKFLRERELAAFAHLYNNKWTEDQIKRELKISKSTYYRYLRALSADQKELLVKYGEDVLLAELGRTRFTFRDTEIQMTEILHDKDKYSASERIEAAGMLCELSLIDLKLLTEGPITTLKEMPMYLKKQLVKTEAHYDPNEQVFNIQIGPEEPDTRDGLEKKKKTKKEE
jgi:predicted transcriptional regulator